MFGSSDICFIEGKGFKGYVFGKDEIVLVSIKQQKSRCTPSKEDILKVEQLLKAKLELANKDLENQLGNYPVIHEKLKKYLRQYVGFVNSKGEKVIWVNFLWNKDLTEKAAYEIIHVQDGGSYFWSIKINIDKEELFELSVNGAT